MVRKTAPDDRSGNAETSFAEFRFCSRHDQISTYVALTYMHLLGLAKF